MPSTTLSSLQPCENQAVNHARCSFMSSEAMPLSKETYSLEPAGNGLFVGLSVFLDNAIFLSRSPRQGLDLACIFLLFEFRLIVLLP